MTEKSRWAKAQQYEKEWWDKRATSIDFEFYKTFAAELVQFTKNEIEITASTKILEIGSGAGGIITYLVLSENRYAIDPLENFYSTQEVFVKQRDSKVKYSNEKGESLSFENDFFDLIIMDNVLDHCDDPKLVMNEAKRVLKNGGVIYFKQNTYHLWGKFIRVIMEHFTIDKGHPFTFTKSELGEIVSINSLKLLKDDRAGYFKTWKKEIFSSALKDKIKGILLVTRDKITYLLKK